MFAIFKLEITQMTVNSRVEKRIVAYSLDGILYSNDNLFTHSMYESHEHKEEWKKPDTKGLVICFHLYEV